MGAMQDKDRSAHRPAPEPGGPWLARGGIPDFSLDFPTSTKALGCACLDVSPLPAVWVPAALAFSSSITAVLPLLLTLAPSVQNSQGRAGPGHYMEHPPPRLAAPAWGIQPLSPSKHRAVLLEAAQQQLWGGEEPLKNLTKALC